jgi:hypothetical protein
MLIINIIKNPSNLIVSFVSYLLQKILGKEILRACFTKTS